MRYLVQVYNDSQAYCRASTKTDAQEAFDRYCKQYPDDHVVFVQNRKGVIAERPATKTEKEKEQL